MANGHKLGKRKKIIVAMETEKIHVKKRARLVWIRNPAIHPIMLESVKKKSAKPSTTGVESQPTKWRCAIRGHRSQDLLSPQDMPSPLVPRDPPGGRVRQNVRTKVISQTVPLVSKIDPPSLEVVRLLSC